MPKPISLDVSRATLYQFLDQNSNANYIFNSLTCPTLGFWDPKLYFGPFSMETSETLTVERISSQTPSVGHVRELNMWIALEFLSKNWHRAALDTSKEIGFGTFWISVSSFEKKIDAMHCPD